MPFSNLRRGSKVVRHDHYSGDDVTVVLRSGDVLLSEGPGFSKVRRGPPSVGTEWCLLHEDIVPNVSGDVDVAVRV